MNAKQRYPGIAKAALEISYDNGGINRDRTEAMMFRKLGRVLETLPYSEHVPEIDRFLGKLSAEDLDTICAGEHTDQQALVALGPPFTDTLLNDVFEKVG